MFKNYFKTSFRNLWKNKVFSAINIAGLAIGMAACILILLFVLYEKRFDGMHSKNIYRLDEVQKFPGMVAPQNVALSMFPMGPTLRSEFPEVANFTRVRRTEKFDLTIRDTKIFLPSAYFVDSTFLQMFDFKLLKGDRTSVLQQPNSILLTEETAVKLFGNEDPIGKTVTHYIGDTTLYTVKGILADVPKNSHLQFDALMSLSTRYGPDNMENWGGNWLVTYLQLIPGANIAAMEKKFPDYLKKHMTENDRWKFYELFLQPLNEIHSGSTQITHDYINFQKFDSRYTSLFTLIAIIVLAIAAINFMNLSTAKSNERAKEVGIRKAIGAQRSQLTAQFLGESVLLTCMALVLALVLVKLSLPYVSALSNRALQFSVLYKEAGMLAGGLAGALGVGLIAGIYPALFLSSFNAIKVLKGARLMGGNKINLRNVLVTIQFTSAIFLIIATVFALRQLRFMETMNPGFSRDQVMIIPLDQVTSPKYDALKTELLASTRITNVSGAQQRLGNNLHQTGVTFHGDGPARDLASSQIIVDPDYLSLYNIQLVAGRNFSHDYASENAKAYIINESLARELLKETPKATMESLVGKRFGFGGMDSAGYIIGIAKDFNFNSLHHKIETLCMLNQKDWGYSEMSVKIKGGQSSAAIAQVSATWKKLFPDHPFEYTFLDEHFDTLYKADAQVSRVVGILAVLAIIISCLGLFGLASYSAERRVKEIGIRKVLGASVQSITTLLSKDFIRLVIIANIIAWPLAWLVMHRWLQDFAYRISLSWMVFLLAGSVAILVAILTISFHAIKTAMANPVKALRSE
jgi:putative ABC transport system permease protein